MIWYLVFIPLLLLASGCKQTTEPIPEQSLSSPESHQVVLAEKPVPRPVETTQIVAIPPTIPIPVAPSKIESESEPKPERKMPLTLPEEFIAYSKNPQPLSKALRLGLVSRLKQEYTDKQYDSNLLIALKQFLGATASSEWILWLTEISFLFPMQRTASGLRAYEIRDLIREISPNSQTDLALIDVFLQGDKSLQDGVYNHLMKRYGQNFGYNHELWKRKLSEGEKTQ